MSPSTLSTRRAAAAFAMVALGACAEDVAMPFELSHARVLAVRTEPARTEPGASAAVQALVTDAAAPPRLAAPTELEVRLPPELDRPELRALVTQTPSGWFVQAPPEPALRELRRALGAAEGAPVAVPVLVRATVASGVLEAQKLVWLGVHADNPPAPQLTVDGADAAEGQRLAVGESRALTLEVPATSAGAAVRWFVSRGELARYTQARATWTLEEDELEGPAIVAVVVRTEDGGVAWLVRSVTLSAQPGG